MTVAAVLWDLDGVLVDTREFHLQAWRRAADEAGFPYDESHFRRTFGQRNDAILAGVLPGRSTEELLALGRRKEAVFRSLVEGRVVALPGAGELVRRLHAAGAGQAIVSSTPRPNIDLILRSLALAGCFQAVVGEEDVRRGKPDPEVLLVAAERLAVAPGRCVVIEDAPAGLEAARRAGMRSVGVASTRAAGELAAADLVVATLADERVGRFLGLE